jgi:nucleoside-diphosphate-sugar epimerase
MSERILVIGACGQIGTELVEALAGIYGNGNVLATDVRDAGNVPDVPYKKLDVLDQKGVAETIMQFRPQQIYHLAALLSATAEKNPKLGWQLNMDGLFYVLDAALEAGVGKVYWPSSIAAFGPNTPRLNTPQYCVMDPNTVYGISKLAGERYAEYYFKRYGLDVRSLRYPGLIGWKAAPGGGTTDYAVSIYYDALQSGHHNCFLREDTLLPMLYMPDAIRATLEIMHAPADQIKIRSSYNLSGMSFTPEGIAGSIARVMPDFTISCEPDYRQAIADSWPGIIDDSRARADWGWKHQFDLDAMTADMLHNLKTVKGIGQQ